MLRGRSYVVHNNRPAHAQGLYGNSEGAVRMSKKTKLKIRLNEVQVERAEEVLALLGLSLSEAVSMFLAQVLLQNGLPFVVSLSAEDDQAIMDQVYETLHGGLNDMSPTDGQLSLDEDNLEVPWDASDSDDEEA